MLKLRNVSKSFELNGQRIPVLESVCLSLPFTGITTIEGPSGSGKSTLLNIVAQSEYPDSGELVKSKNLALGYAPQHSFFIDELTVLDNLKLVSRKNKTTSLIEPYCDQLQCKSLLRKYPWVLSGGEKQRINVIRAFLGKSDLVILDEPSSSLDAASKKRLEIFLNDQASTCALLIVTHDARFRDSLNPFQSFKLEDTYLIAI